MGRVVVPGTWEVLDEPVNLTWPTEWRQEVPGVKAGDKLRLEADGDGPFYAGLFAPGERKDEAWSRKYTWFKLGSARESWDISRDAPADGTYVVSVVRRGFDWTLTTHVWLELRRPSVGPFLSIGQKSPEWFSDEMLPEARVLPAIGAGWYVALGVGWLAILLAAFFAVFFANLGAWVYGGGTRVLPELLAGDGTLALALVTAVGLMLTRKSQSLEARLDRRLRNRGAHLAQLEREARQSKTRNRN